MSTTTTGHPQALRPPGPLGAKRLLRELGDGAVSLAEHRRTMAPPRPVRTRPADHLIDDVAAAGLRGRGGASFPTAIKLRTVATARRRPTVVINGSEGEPASAKDRVLLTRLPHLVLDGALAAAAATRADGVIVCLDRADHASISAVEGALVDRARAGEPTVGLRIATVPARFVAGEESALVNLLNGGEAKPTTKPPRVFERGVGGRPTLVINVETAAHLAQITQWGSAWFRACGTDDEPGTLLATISGAVRHPGVVELALGTSIVDAVRAAGGPTRPPAAVLVGGYYGSWLSATDAATAVMTNASLRPLDAGLGCGAIVVVPEDCCGLAETARLLAWMSAQSAGQCGPCVHGLPALADAMGELAAGRPRPDTPARLRRWAGMIDGRGACTFPDGAARLVRTTLRAFEADIEHHLHHGPCWRTANRPLLPTPPTTGDWR